MTNVGTHGLTCLDENDPAAVALSMQCNAQAIDAALASIDADLDTYLGRWWWSATNLNALNVSNASGSVLPEGLVGADFLQDAQPLVVQANGFPAIASFPSTFHPPAGIYLCGSTIKWTVATPNNGSSRTLLVTGVTPVNGFTSVSPPGPGGPVYMTTEYERSAAGNDGSETVIGMFEVGPTFRYFSAGFSHNNTSSVLVIPAGAWRMWFIRIGSGLVF